MRETRIPVSDLKVGQMVVKVGSKEVNSRVSADLYPVTAGMKLVGPKGGRKTVRDGAGRLVLPLANGRSKIVEGSALAVALTDGE
jgi:hypothetical protein